ncbi:uncharacterized protein E0L32_000503 [Thyridium curvatum]|uniref:Steroid 5-alpha reductase C-terminal domain-containing protein n=1 Tax=Thyridium curvatum TaxID=1093900 RepID=A0A507B9N8_9PEZI|nr:uncharacterized protein E0L32_000503 [Thyridium curvatum]TPX14109.1 hypothetical protein E0L32_000503 [Thyridium curvatum]
MASPPPTAATGGSPGGTGSSSKMSRYDLINRSEKGTSAAGLLTFVGLRALDPFLQYKILAGGWGAAVLSRLGLAVVAGQPAARTGVSLIDGLGLSLPQLVVLAMAVGSVAKQVFWVAYLNNEVFGPGPAAVVTVYNALFNSANSLMLTAAATSAALYAGAGGVRIPGLGFLPLPVAAGAALYAAGVTAETAAELQRKRFKDDPANRGRICDRGLWGLVRHANYAGYAVWRAGYCLASGGLAALFTVGMQPFVDFSTRAIPTMDEYMTGRYGERWAQYKRDVPYRLIPGLW